MPSEFVTLSIVITMEHFYLVREISMGNRCCTQPRCTILSFVIDIFHDRGVYLYTHTHTYIITSHCVVLYSRSSPLIVISPGPFRARTCLLSFILYYYYYYCCTFALGASDRDLCRSVNSVGGRASMAYRVSLRHDVPPVLNSTHRIIAITLYTIMFYTRRLDTMCVCVCLCVEERDKK